MWYSKNFTPLSFYQLLQCILPYDDLMSLLSANGGNLVQQSSLFLGGRIYTDAQDCCNSCGLSLMWITNPLVCPADLFASRNCWDSCRKIWHFKWRTGMCQVGLSSPIWLMFIHSCLLSEATFSCSGRNFEVPAASMGSKWNWSV